MMSEESRMILEQLGQINQNVLEMKEDISELKSDVANLKTDVKNLKIDMVGLKTDVESLKSDMLDVKEKVINLESGQRELHLLVENEISKKINIVGEDHFFVMKALNELRGFQEEKEMMDLKILDLQIEMKRVKKVLKIA